MYSDEEVREAEQFLLGGLMVKPALTDEILKITGTETDVFSTQETKAIFSAVVSLYQRNEEINPLTIWIEIETLDVQDKILGGAKLLRDLYAQIVETESTLSYAKVVREAFGQRQAKQRAHRIAAAPSVDEAILEEAARIEAHLQTQGEPETDVGVPFPRELLTGVFSDYVEAYQDCTEVSPSLLFGTLKTLIGGVLGRRVSLGGVTPLYPNFYSVVVGHTGLARKSTAISLAETALQRGDDSVFVLRSVATPEGLIQAFVPPDGYRFGSAVRMEDTDEEKAVSVIEESQLGNMLQQAKENVEGFRILLSIDEFSHLLKKAGKQHGDGLIQMLATAYNFPSKLHLPTRVSPLTADHPCLSLIGATTLQWLESSLKLEDIQGGFANRITYYLGSDTDWIFLDRQGDGFLLSKVVDCLSNMRIKFDHPVEFYFDEETEVEGQRWYESHRNELLKESNPLVVLASTRTDVHVKKCALLYAALGNYPDDPYIHRDAFDWAVTLSEYLQDVVKHIYSNFNFSEARRLETKIIEMVGRNPHMTAREITQRIRWASAREVNAACRELVDNGTLGEQPAGRTSRFYLFR